MMTLTPLFYILSRFQSVLKIILRPIGDIGKKASLFTLFLSMVGFGIIGTPVYAGSKLEHAPAPKVVASIAPFYNLVAGIMQGVGTPQLLVPIGASPHDYALRTSDVKMLQQADILFWGGPELETFLVKPLKATDHKKNLQIVELDKTPGLLILPERQGARWEAHEHGHNHKHGHGHEHNHKHSHEHSHDAHNHAHMNDMHFWLDPDNAKILIDHITQKLSSIDTKNAAIYQRNAQNLKAELTVLDKQLKAKLKKVKKIPFIVFHDAYQYFERHYDLRGVGSITIHPELPPSAQRLNTIRDIIRETHAACVFTEPQFQPKLVQTIIQDTGVRTGVLDPLGKIIESNQQNNQQSEHNDNMNNNGYITTLKNLAEALSKCLESNS